MQVSTCLVYHVNIQKEYGITNEYWKILAQGKQKKVEKFTIFVIIANVNLKYVFQSNTIQQEGNFGIVWKIH